MATQLITSMDEPWKPDRYRDTYTDRVNDLIEAKRRGHEVQQADEAPEATNVIDLFEALRQSVDWLQNPTERARPARPARAVHRRGRAKKKPAKKRTAKATAKRAPAKNAVAKKTTTKKATASTKRSARKAS